MYVTQFFCPPKGKSPRNTNVFYLSFLQMKSDWTVEKKMLEQLLSDLKGQLREKEEKLNLVTAQEVCRFFLFVTFFLYFFLPRTPPPRPPPPLFFLFFSSKMCISINQRIN
jgi:hypothetical protein